MSRGPGFGKIPSLEIYGDPTVRPLGVVVKLPPFAMVTLDAHTHTRREPTWIMMRVCVYRTNRLINEGCFVTEGCDVNNSFVLYEVLN